MFAFRTLVPLALLSFAAAQSTDASVGVAAIKAHFQQAKLVGQGNLLSSFDPTAVMNVTYPEVGAITPGQKFTKEQVNEKSGWPTVTVTAANSSSLSGNYTIIMVDADYVGADISNGTTRHWLLNGVTVGSDGKVDNATATAVEGYAGPWPAAGSGAHRYCILFYEQPSSFVSPADLVGGIVPIQLDDYVSNSHLGALVAGTYIQVEEGTSTVTAASTSSVNSATLVAQSTGSASASGSKTSGASGSSPSASASAGGSNGAFQAAFAPVLVVASGLLASTVLL